MVAVNLTNAVDIVEDAGMILVFPIANQKEPSSLWTAFHPRTKMRWEWDESGDNRVGELWHLRTELSQSSDVVYAKWYRGRATVFSKTFFRAVLRVLNTPEGAAKPLLHDATAILDLLNEDSPQSPRTLREAVDLKGKFNESAFNRALKDLWSRLLIVGFGEIDDGAFPSLAIGSSKLLFEDEWNSARTLSLDAAHKILASKFAPDSVFYRYLTRTERSLSQTKTSVPAGKSATRRFKERDTIALD